MAWQTLAIAGIAGALAAGAAAWEIQDWRLGATIAGLEARNAENLKAVSDTATAAAVAAAAQETSWQAKLDDQDARSTKELQDVQADATALRARLDAGTVSMSVTVARSSACRGGVPKAASAGSVGHGAATGGTGTVAIQLPTAVADDLTALAGDADSCAAKLTYLQGYARTLMESTPAPDPKP